MSLSSCLEKYIPTSQPTLYPPLLSSSGGECAQIEVKYWVARREKGAEGFFEFGETEGRERERGSVRKSRKKSRSRTKKEKGVE